MRTRLYTDQGESCMKRLHVHVAIDDLQKSIRFYSALFAAEPTVVKPDYAKWSLEDPRVNFAISKRGRKAGLDHLGIQVENAEELEEMNQRLSNAELPTTSQVGTTCCYAKSDKHWTIDPQGIPWESFHSLTNVPMYGQDIQPEESASACCANEPCGVSAEPAKEARSACCA